MKRIKWLLSFLSLSGILALNAVPIWGAEGVIYKVVAIPDSNYCHLKFPAIREATLYWERPALKHPSEGDIVDFYGSCDHDPLGKEEILRQRADLRREQSRGGD